MLIHTVVLTKLYTGQRRLNRRLCSLCIHPDHYHNSAEFSPTMALRQ